MKQVFTAHDILTVVTELKRLGVEGSYLQNCYDASSRSLCLKLSGWSGTDESQDSEKESTRQKFNLLLDSGSRIQLLDSFQAVRQAPSGFCMKLRKHLKNRKLVAINQINRDRVVDFVFGNLDDEANCHHLIIELYASGNLILLEGGTHKILMLLHRHTYQEESKDKDTEKDKESTSTEDTRVKIGAIYPWHLATASLSDYEIDPYRLSLWLQEEVPKLTKKIKWRQLLIRSPLGIFGPALIDHTLSVVGLSGKVGATDPLPDTSFLKAMITELERVQTEPGSQGYIVFDEKDQYASFVPMQYHHLEKKKLLKFPTFLAAVKQFFHSRDETKLASLAKQEEQKKEEKKTEKLTQKERTLASIQQRTENLQEQMDQTEQLRLYLESNFEILNTLWPILKGRTNIRTFMESAAKSGLKITKIEPHKKSLILETPHGPVTLNYSQSLYKNLGNLHQNRKSLDTKKKRTTEVYQEVSKKLSKETKKINKNRIDLSQTRLTKNRKVHWFEKYHWCYTSDQDLLVVGKNAQQNEELVKKYLTPKDIYLHSDVAGSGSGILKKADPEAEFSIRSLSEAGAFVICHTKAWVSGSPDKAWWVYPDQVSKTPETGEYVAKGSFIIRGKKNYLPLPKLELGLTILSKNHSSPGFSSGIEDDVEYLLPMVAPYSTVNKERFCAKLVPGPGKAGKTVKMIKEKFKKTKRIKPIEITALGLVKDDDWNRVMVTKVRML